LRHEFKIVDTDNSGFIEKSELRDTIEKSNVSLSQEELDEIINQLDFSQNNKINYSEFLSATIDLD
jgi:Ca2+-binding EF-hand superfamily protein